MADPLRSSISSASPAITLLDNTVAASDPPTPRASPRASSEASGHVGLTSVLNRREPNTTKRQVLRKAIAERHYKRWVPDDDADGEAGTVIARSNTPSAGTPSPEPTPSISPSPARGRKQDLPVEAAIDILYENQRGCFLCGIPLYSSKSLLNFDPSAWQNHLYHNSAVSIANAQLPDPSWVWDWKSWYVDMTGDVDEEGWAYSFSFSPAFAWHGEHGWVNSFARRRRWLRKRIRPTEARSRSASRDAGHGLNGDYFTIHSKRSSWLPQDAEQEEAEAQARMPVVDIPTLMKAVKRARLDREKVVTVLKFLRDGGEELVYLQDHVADLMGAMMFQESKRQLLRAMVDYQTAFEERRGVEGEFAGLMEENGGSGDEVGNDEARTRKLENLAKAVEAADAEVKKMEFWSDLKGVAQEGESVTAEDGGRGWGDTGISGAGQNELKGKAKLVE